MPVPLPSQYRDWHRKQPLGVIEPRDIAGASEAKCRRIQSSTDTSDTPSISGIESFTHSRNSRFRQLKLNR